MFVTIEITDFLGVGKNQSCQKFFRKKEDKEIPFCCIFYYSFITCQILNFDVPTLFYPLSYISSIVLYLLLKTSPGSVRLDDFPIGPVYRLYVEFFILTVSQTLHLILNVFIFTITFIPSITDSNFFFSQFHHQKFIFHVVLVVLPNKSNESGWGVLKTKSSGTSSRVL